MRFHVCIAALTLATGASAAPLTVPFDYSQSAIGLDVTIKGTPLHMILDTGVDPSAVDSARATALKLPVDKGNGGEATGEGDAKQAQIYPATITGLVIAGRAFPDFDAASMNMAGLSKRYGRTLDGILGYSFLNGQVVLIDYPRHELSLLDQPADAWAAVKTCSKRWTVPLKQLPDDNIPVIDDFRLGDARISITLDTGSNRGIALSPSALELPGVKAALVEKGESATTGARGDTKYKTYVLNAPVGFGPFDLPAGQVAAVRGEREGPQANIGNQLFAGMKLKMLLDYKAKLMTFYGGCRA